MSKKSENRPLTENEVNTMFKAKEKTQQRKKTPYERTKDAVYATGNKWAIENFHATHD